MAASRRCGANMGRIINPRGTSGAGKTWLVREAMKAYCRTGAVAAPLRREGRSRPIGWRLTRSGTHRPLAVIGHYEATRGGTDTIPDADGGLDEAIRLAGSLACEGHDVLLEGLQLSGDVERTAALARAQQMRGGTFHVLHLDAPLDACVRNVVFRRRAGRTARPAIEATAQAGQAAVRAACEALRRQGVDVEALDAATTLRRTLALLGLASPESDGQAEEWQDSLARPMPSVPAASGSPTPTIGAR